LALAPQPVIVITKTPSLTSGSTPWAQGGIAAALAADDSARLHHADTIEAGADLCDPTTSQMLTEDGPRTIARLLTLGMPFDRADDGRLAMAREAAHSRARVVHAGGDSTGKALAETLIAQVEAAPSIQVMTATTVVDLALDGAPDQRLRGLLIHGPQGWQMIAADAVVLASGGMGMAWQETTNPAENTGDGLAMAARAQVLLADLEFMQFHPTALRVGDGSGARLPLLTEALRGAGALLLDGQGQRFMVGEHPLAELAPRDVVARAVGLRQAAGEDIFLDLRPALAREGAAHFPQVLESCHAHGLDPSQGPVPIAPAAHYLMGGVVTDPRVHGANRLASNSLLEALVFGDRVASDIVLALADGRLPPRPGPRMQTLPQVADPAACAEIMAALRQIMSRSVGLIRDHQGLTAAAEALADLSARFDALPKAAASAETVRPWAETRALLTVAPLVVQAALQRQESRGAHARLDYPERRADHRQRVTLRLGDPAIPAQIAPLPGDTFPLPTRSLL
jgi:L-aspartate oxidase